MPLAPHADVPDHLPVTVKPWFFSRSERAFYLELVTALRGTGYVVFPNVRLNDLFLISKAAENRQSVLGRLRDKHVDFLILEERDFKPVLAIEPGGASHDTDRQRYRDEVKNTAFRSAGLRLLRFDARQSHSAKSLQADLVAHLPLLQAV